MVLILEFSHMISVHKYRRGFRCQQCNTQFDTIDQFVGHAQIHAHKPFMCEICDVNFQSKVELAQHRKTEQHRDALKLVQLQQPEFQIEQKNIKCPSCDFRCSSMEELSGTRRIFEQDINKTFILSGWSLRRLFSFKLPYFDLKL